MRSKTHVGKLPDTYQPVRQVLKTISLAILIVLAGQTVVFGQCDNTLVNLAVKKLNNDDIFIREFRIKLKKATFKKPEPVAKYSFYLKEGIQYKFEVTNAKENESQAIIQIYKRDNLILSSFNFDTHTTTNTLNFECPEEGMYKMQASYSNGNEGCAVVTLSMKITAENEVPAEKFEEIYTGIETPLSIYTDASEGCEVSHDITMGNLYKKNDELYILVKDTGLVKIYTRVSNKDGDILEEATTTFRAINPPLPFAQFKNVNGGILNPDDVVENDEIYIVNPLTNYDNKLIIKGFSIARTVNSIESVSSGGSTLSYQQFNFIRSLKNGEKLCFFNIKVVDENNNSVEVAPMCFMIFK